MSETKQLLQDLREKFSLKGSIKGQEPSWKNTLTRAFINKSEKGEYDFPALQRENALTTIKRLLAESFSKGEKLDVIQFMLESGEKVEHTFGQWKVTMGKFGIEIDNLGDNGERRFYSMRPGGYDNPVRVAEPDLAFDVPDDLVLVDADGKQITLESINYTTKDISNGQKIENRQKISGIICRGENGPRSSLSNPDFLRIGDESGTNLKDDDFRNVRGLFNRVFWHMDTPKIIKTFQMVEGKRVDRTWYLS